MIVSESLAHLAFEYFSGFVPPGPVFQIHLNDLRKIANTPSRRLSGANRAQELCFIGLVSYFEAFCKDHFACLINIEPSLLANLRHAGQDVSVDANRVLLFGAEVTKKMGFIVAEKYDFGTAQKINALYTALLKLAPFSKDEARRYAEVLNERNLLVHHGGTYTLTFLEQAGVSQKEIKKNAFVYSKTPNKKDTLAAIDFIDEIAQKMVKSSHEAISKYVQDNDIAYNDERKKALDYLSWLD